jgi:hypothetical protein
MGVLMKKTARFLGALVGLAAIISSSQAVAAPSRSTSTAGMRFCKKNESPIIIVNGARVQVCRNNYDLSKGEMQAIGTIIGAVNRDNNPELTKNLNLCTRVSEAGEFEAAKPYCIKASELGSSQASYILGIASLKTDPKLDQEETRKYLDKASLGGEHNSTLLLAGYYARSGDLNRMNNYLLRCFDKDIITYSNLKKGNGSGYSAVSLSPQLFGYYKQGQRKCTNLVFDQAVRGNFPLNLIGISANGSNIVEPKISDKIYGEYSRPSKYDTYFSIRLNITSEFSQFDYMELWDSNFEFDEDIIYKVLVINDDNGVPQVYSCATYDLDNKLLKKDVSDKICDFILLKHNFVSGIDRNGNMANGIATGRMRVNYAEFPGAPKSSRGSARQNIGNNVVGREAGQPVNWGAALTVLDSLPRRSDYWILKVAKGVTDSFGLRDTVGQTDDRGGLRATGKVAYIDKANDLIIVDRVVGTYISDSDVLVARSEAQARNGN